jgi:hypothetical protein
MPAKARDQPRGGETARRRAKGKAAKNHRNQKRALALGAYSDTSVPIFGIAAPSPSPVIKRKKIICSMFCEKAVAMVQKPKKKTLLTMIFSPQPVGERPGEKAPAPGQSARR